MGARDRGWGRGTGDGEQGPRDGGWGTGARDRGQGERDRGAGVESQKRQPQIACKHTHSSDGAADGEVRGQQD